MSHTLLHVFPTFAVGGAQTRFASVANHFGGAAKHLILSLDGETGAREKLRSGLDVAFLPPPPAQGTIRTIRTARRLMAEHAPDLLVTSNWGSMNWAIAGRLAGMAHLHTEDGFGPEERDHQLRRRVWVRRLALRRSDIALPSRNLLHIAREIWRLPERQLHYIPNGIDLRRFASAAPRAIPGEGPVIGTIAALRPEKHLSRLIRAVAALSLARHARLVIVGDGPSRPGLENEARALGLDVIFAGHSQEPESWLAAFDIFALSSDTEQMPLSVLEAMAAGLPVAATDVGDVRQMVAAENAPFIVERSAQALAGALKRLLAEPEAARAIGRANRARAELEFGEDAMFARYGKLWGLVPP